MPRPSEGATGRGEEAFPKSRRLLKRHEFLRARARGRKVHTAHLIGLALPSATGERRLGVTVSAKVGNAVERNLVKRRLREIFRRRRDALPKAIDLVLIAKTGAPQIDQDTLLSEFLEIARRLSQPGGPGARRSAR
ncbi:MAG TPA: ribonuclease P protein component [Vulgatibacter sp.]|nr:ribonuclease P protein component [Vulgatibacter sp.]